MKRAIVTFMTSMIMVFNCSPAFAHYEVEELPKCIVVTHCVLESWEVNEIEDSFKKAVEVLTNSPRTQIVEKTDSYIHAEVKTISRRYTDDLLLKVLPEKRVIQVRSESRVGIGDMGVNQRRVDDLADRLSIIKRF